MLSTARPICMILTMRTRPLQVLQRVISSLKLPGAAILEWLEGHAQLRLSILLTYLFGKSVLFTQLMRWLSLAIKVW